MLLYSQSWMFYNHFIVILYPFLVLTYWHSVKCQLLFLHVFYIAGNQYKTESKCNQTLQRFFMDQKTPRGLGVKARRATRRRQGWRARPRGGRAPYLVLSWLMSWRRVQVLWITFVPKITFPKVSFRLDSVWYYFPAKHWNRQKNSNLHWALG